MKKGLLIIFFLFILKIACAQNTSPYHKNSFQKIGYLEPNSGLDDPNFEVCNKDNITEYYQVNPVYREGLFSIKTYFKPVFEKLNGHTEADGLIVLRFVINCEGKTGRFRSEYFNEAYQKNDSNEKLQNQLIKFTKELGDWQPGIFEGQSYDCYQQLKFKIKDKVLTDVFY